MSVVLSFVLLHGVLNFSLDRHAFLYFVSLRLLNDPLCFLPLLQLVQLLVSVPLLLSYLLFKSSLFLDFFLVLDLSPELHLLDVLQLLQFLLLLQLSLLSQLLVQLLLHSLLAFFDPELALFLLEFVLVSVVLQDLSPVILLNFDARSQIVYCQRCVVPS